MYEVSIYCQSRDNVGEGPFWSEKDQALYWIDIIGKKLNCLPVGSKEVKSWMFLEMVCGVVPRHNGELIVALCQTVGSFDVTSEKYTPLIQIDTETPGNRNNEMKCDPKGRLWIGTMQENVNPDGTAREITQKSGNLFCLHPDLTLKKYRTGMGISNTLAWSIDHKTMYFGDSMADTIWAHEYDIDSGDIKNPVPFLSDQNAGAPDGSAIDQDGWIWNARFGAGCVLRVSPDGKTIERIDIPVTNPTSCAFGGPNMDILFVTSAQFTLDEKQLEDNPNEGAVAAIKTNTRGLPTVAFSG